MASKSVNKDHPFASYEEAYLSLKEKVAGAEIPIHESTASEYRRLKRITPVSSDYPEGKSIGNSLVEGRFTKKVEGVVNSFDLSGEELTKVKSFAEKNIKEAILVGELGVAATFVKVFDFTEEDLERMVNGAGKQVAVPSNL